MTNSQTRARVIGLLALFTDDCPAARGMEAGGARLDGVVVYLTE